MLETLGSISAAHLYQSYLNIGLLADAVEKESYTEEQANDMLATVVNLMGTVDKQLEKLSKMDLGEDDIADVERIRDLSGLLHLQVARASRVLADRRRPASGSLSRRPRKSLDGVKGSVGILIGLERITKARKTKARNTPFRAFVFRAFVIQFVI